MVVGGCLCGVALARCGLRGNGRSYVRCCQKMNALAYGTLAYGTLAYGTLGAGPWASKF